MRIRPRFALPIIAALLAAGTQAAESFRTWHTIGGGYFEAKLTDVGTTKAVLENREGRSIDFPLADLKPSDQNYVRAWQVTQSREASEPEATAPAAARSAFGKQVYRDLVYSKGKRLARFEAEPGDSPKYFAFYRSAHWCPPCRAFTPKLVDFYKKQKRRGAAFELIFISSDKDEDAMAEYMEEYGMPWPAFPFGENKDIVARNGTGIPNLMVTDAEGNKLLDSYDSSRKYIGPTAVMNELEALLK